MSKLFISELEIKEILFVFDHEMKSVALFLAWW